MAQTAVSFDISPEQEASQLQFYRRQLFASTAPAVTKADANLSGKTAVVTGASGGIGLECCRQLLDLGLGKLIVAVRSLARGEETRKILLEERRSGGSAQIEIWALDYASYDSITTFARRVEELDPPLDIAILNAGVHRGGFHKSPNTGHEDSLQTNYLSTALLSLLLVGVFDKTRSSSGHAERPSPGRIVLVSSDMAAWTKFGQRNKSPLLPAFDDPAGWDGMDRYGTTKLLGQLFVAELAKRVSPSVAIINCANPGLCHGSNLANELGTVAAVYIRLIGRTSAVGARSLIHAAVLQTERSHGQYVEDGELRP